MATTVRSRSRSSSRSRPSRPRSRSISRVRTLYDDDKKQEVPPPGCICFRDYGTVFCTGCGFSHSGRVRKECKVHPRTMYLLDIAQCPVCRAYPPILTEFPKM